VRENTAGLTPYAQHFGRDIGAVETDLRHFLVLLEKWQAVQNLVSRETLAEAWDRHVLDSLQVLPFWGEAKTVLDLGSGGGLPALPLAIAKKGSDVRFTLVEPNSRKVSFLRTVIRELNLNATVEACRIEELSPQTFGPVDLVTSRALASLVELFAMMLPFCSANTRAVLHKGKSVEGELTLATARFSFAVIAHESATDSSGTLLEISDLRAATSLRTLG
jgi:16S rRNA (guanine527-N7)-methyltransferase